MENIATFGYWFDIIIGFFIGVLASIVAALIIIRLSKKSKSIVFDQTSFVYYDIPPDYAKTEEIHNGAVLINNTILVTNNGIDDIIDKDFVDDDDNPQPIVITLPENCFIKDPHIGRHTKGVKGVKIQKTSHNVFELSWEKLKANKSFEIILEMEASYERYIEIIENVDRKFLKTIVISSPSSFVSKKKDSVKSNEIASFFNPRMAFLITSIFLVLYVLLGILMKPSFKSIPVYSNINIEKVIDSISTNTAYEGILYAESFHTIDDSIKTHPIKEFLSDSTIKSLSITKIKPCTECVSVSTVLPQVFWLTIALGILNGIAIVVYYIFRKENKFDDAKSNTSKT